MIGCAGSFRGPQLVCRQNATGISGRFASRAHSSDSQLRRPSALFITLEHHTQCHQSFRVASDILPSTLPRLLAGGKLDRIALWHVRSVDIWGGRRTWADWKPHSLLLPNTAVTTPAHSTIQDSFTPPRPYGPGFLSQDELDVLTSLMEDELHFDHATARHWRSSIEDGCDIALKGLVIALSPRLEHLRVIMAPCEMPQDTSRDYFDRLKDPDKHAAENTLEFPSCQELDLRFIGKSIRMITKSADKKLLWPPGFASLRNVAVGIHSLATPYAQTAGAHQMRSWINTPAIAPLFALPGVATLYAAGLADPGYADTLTIDPVLEPGKSSIKSLFFSECTMQEPTLKRLVKACETVKTLTLQRCDTEAFILSDMHTVLSRHCMEGLFDGLVTLGKTPPLPASDFAEFTSCLVELLRACQSRHINITNLEYSGTHLSQRRLQVLLDEALTHVFENEVADDRDDFKPEAIFLTEAEVPSREAFGFRKAIVAGREVGVEVITAATPMSEEVRSLLPRGASELDLESSPWRGHALVKGLTVHPERGLELGGCNACGRCQVCLGKYPTELWRQRDDGAYFTHENLEKWRTEDEAKTAQA
ncbi:uncharacterized protein B0I36DRAFT_431892 [Microdochium trichocladiopsis]|uniref:Uncharacterized protein n=1 Tax=Microdochium trichocladiopsis TaxID=1682393 RepID=A0A9P9BP81_9PEZI|nr:uncharacterized protein B0I36DRAFT_431892 [Microdochium trichocladiopsis]KAH7028977.1 hypothetical protein B0I36DRAFT_431892 [Microdochium trichocladiopsis]